jgi:hypothetical protein
MEELKPAEILKAVQTCGASFCTTDHHKCPYGDEGCIDCVDRLEAGFEALIAAGDDLIIRRAAPENDYAALKAKYDEINRYNVSCTKKIDELLAAKVAAPENKALTLDELRQMDGEPVWVVNPEMETAEWMLCDAKRQICIPVEGYFIEFSRYGIEWLAYARRPEAPK